MTIATRLANCAGSSSMRDWNEPTSLVGRTSSPQTSYPASCNPSPIGKPIEPQPATPTTGLVLMFSWQSLLPGVPGSLLDVFDQLSWSDFTAVHIALRIHSQSFRRAGSFHLERIRDTVQHLAVLQATDPDPSLPSRVSCKGEAV